MEQSEYAERTLQLFKRTFHPEFGNTVGVVLQSYLRRTEQDVEQMIALGARVRLCKGAYQEPATVAFPGKRDVDTTYVGCMERLLLRGTYPGIATHDARIIEHAKTFARDKGVAPARFEFQMLYGVRRDLQLALRRQGYNVRVYVPFGSQWYPYLMRRLAERPANVAFLLGNVLRESLRRSMRTVPWAGTSECTSAPPRSPGATASPTLWGRTWTMLRMSRAGMVRRCCSYVGPTREIVRSATSRRTTCSGA